MRNKPDLLTLLEATRKSLAERVAPSLSGAARYEVLLAISAIGTTVREMTDFKEHGRDEEKQLLRLLGRHETASDCDLETLEQDLAIAIRDGRFSGVDDTEALLAYLKQSSLRHLAITNPGVAADYGAR